MQINFNCRQTADGQILETSTLVNLRSDDLSECISLFEQLKKRLNKNLTDGTTKESDIGLRLVKNGIRPEAKECPNCGSKMLLRTSKNGKNPGAQFWGCSQFVRTGCEATLPV